MRQIRKIFRRKIFFSSSAFQPLGKPICKPLQQCPGIRFSGFIHLLFHRLRCGWYGLWQFGAC